MTLRFRGRFMAHIAVNRLRVGMVLDAPMDADGNQTAMPLCEITEDNVLVEVDGDILPHQPAFARMTMGVYVVEVERYVIIGKTSQEGIATEETDQYIFRNPAQLLQLTPLAGAKGG